MKVCLYARVSKEEEGMQDPNNQLIPLRKFCESMQWEIKKEFIDRASGGSANRPAFQLMLSEVKQRHFDLILIWALDRFSREGIVSTLKYCQLLNDYKTSLKSLQESWLDTRDEGMGQLMLAMMAWFAQQERKRISDRTKAGLKQKKEEGKILGRPKGWRKSKIKGVQNPSYKNTQKEVEV
ncbi:MAG: recombinase family protein [Candidatus Pacearchaeota archaeon]|jgi:DNA invertase Pin-like site-specific DNA recombinase